MKDEDLSGAPDDHCKFVDLAAHLTGFSRLMTDNTFQLSGFVFPGVNEDPFGLWDVVPASSGISFGVGETAAPEAPVHRSNFTTPDEGVALLAAKQRALQDQQATLTQIEQRLAEIGRSGGGVSFAAPIDQPPEFVAPEQSLEAALQRLTAPVSYGLFDRKQQAEQEADLEATSQWHKFLEEAREMITNYARVETANRGRADRADGGRVDGRLPHDLDTGRHRRRHAGASAQRRI